jgi:hypothetical protein
MKFLRFLFPFFFSKKGSSKDQCKDADLNNKHNEVKKQYVAPQSKPKPSKYEGTFDNKSNRYVKRKNGRVSEVWYDDEWTAIDLITDVMLLEALGVIDVFPDNQEDTGYHEEHSDILDGNEQVPEAPEVVQEEEKAPEVQAEVSGDKMETYFEAPKENYQEPPQAPVSEPEPVRTTTTYTDSGYSSSSGGGYSSGGGGYDSGDSGGGDD